MACETARWKSRRASSRRSWRGGEPTARGAASRSARSAPASRARSNSDELRCASGRGWTARPAAAPRRRSAIAERLALGVEEERIGPEDARDSRPRRGRGSPPRGTAGPPSRRARPRGRRRLEPGSSGRRSHSKRASSTCSTSLHGARAASAPSAARSAITSSTASCSGRARSADPLVDDLLAGARPLGPGGLAGEAVEGLRQELHHAQQRVGVAALARRRRSRRSGVRARRRRLALFFGVGAQARSSSAGAGDDPGVAADLRPTAPAARACVAPRSVCERDRAKVRNSMTAARSRPRQRKSSSSERAERPKRSGSEGCSRCGMPSRVEQVGEERRVGRRAAAGRRPSPRRARRAPPRAAAGARWRAPRRLRRARSRARRRPSWSSAARCSPASGSVARTALRAGVRAPPAARRRPPWARGSPTRRLRGRRTRRAGPATSGCAAPAAGRAVACASGSAPRAPLQTRSRRVELEIVDDQQLGPFEPSRASRPSRAAASRRYWVCRAPVEPIGVARVEPGQC